MILLQNEVDSQFIKPQSMKSRGCLYGYCTNWLSITLWGCTLIMNRPEFTHLGLPLRNIQRTIEQLRVMSRLQAQRFFHVQRKLLESSKLPNYISLTTSESSKLPHPNCQTNYHIWPRLSLLENMGWSISQVSKCPDVFSLTLWLFNVAIENHHF